VDDERRHVDDLAGGFAGFIKGTWDTDDPSYARPMDMATPVERW